jgi:hypothetical protein
MTDDDEARQRAIAHAYHDLSDSVGQMAEGWIIATIAHAHGVTPTDVIEAVKRADRMSMEPRQRWWRRMMGI